MWLVVLALMQTMSLDSIRDREFIVTVDGPVLTSFPSGRPCVYWEWAAGELRDGAWAVRIAGAHSGSTLLIKTPQGTVQLSHGSVRLYVGPAAAHRYSQSRTAPVPEPLRELLREMDPLTVEEYVLEPGRAYFARVEIETSMLPPRGDEPPKRRRTLVLGISDLPFVNGKPQRPLAPSFAGLAR